MGGWAEITSEWPLARHDHPLYFHSALVTRSFLRESGTTAGYDPAFMAGYAKSVVFPASSTLPEVVVFLAGSNRPEVVFKLYVLIAAASVPWLWMAIVRAWGGRGSAACLAVILGLIYLWTDFPISYATFGMLPYLVAVPLGLWAVLAIVESIEAGGFIRWTWAAFLASLCVFCHLTLAAIVAPAAFAAILAAVRQLTRTRILGIVGIPLVVLAANAFWWWPGPWLASTKGASDFAFHHPEGIVRRLVQIVWNEAPIQSVLWGLGGVGFTVWARRSSSRAATAGFLAFAFMGFAWGYLAAGFRELDFFQPGRHTYVLYTALALMAGLGLAPLWEELIAREGKPFWSRPSLWIAFAFLVIGCRLFGPALTVSIRALAFGPVPFLSSRPPPHLRWIVENVRKHVRPGERLLYEEGGKAVAGAPEPFDGGRYSGLLPHFCGIEVLGGPYLHAALKTNFTQFGEGKLFENDHWGREDFIKYARFYRPAAILCWSRRARAFCRANPDLIRMLGEDGPVVLGRVLGFEGATIEGRLSVEARPGRLIVRRPAAELDGSAVLRYHFAPFLKAVPPVPIRPVPLEGDPVPFIGVTLPPGIDEVELKLDLPP